MKRNSLVAYEDATPEVKAIYDEIMETMGEPEVFNVFKVLGANATILRAVWSMLKGTLIEGEIPPLLKQLILFRISVITGNKYCESLHAHAACNIDPTFTYDDLIALSEGQELEKLPSSFRVAIEIVTEAAINPKGIEDESFEFEEELRDEGFSESEIDELMAQAYFGVMMSLITDAYEIPLESPLPVPAL